MTKAIESVVPQLSVRVVPVQPHCFAFGGFELQMIGAMEAVRASGARVDPLDFWRREADFDVLHLWGLELQHAQTVRWAHAAGKKIVLSALVSYPGLRSRLRYMASSLVGPVRLKRPMLDNVDCVTVVNRAQARYVTGTLGFPEDRVAIVPNIIEDVFFDAADNEGAERSKKGYVLCVGNICRRKNQLALMVACRTIDVPVLLVGSVLTGEEDYGRAVKRAVDASPGSEWIPGLAPGSAELASVFRSAAAFALLSHEEQQPISALEAAACGLPLVLGKRPYALQEFYEGASLADLSSSGDIVRALRKALDRPAEHRAPRPALERCKRSAVGAAYRAIYESLVRTNL